MENGNFISSDVVLKWCTLFTRFGGLPWKFECYTTPMSGIVHSFITSSNLKYQELYYSNCKEDERLVFLS